MIKKIITLVSLLTINQLAFAQQCKVSTIKPSNDAQQFVIDTVKGTAIDARTGLEWALCSTGQTWQNGNCMGTPTHFATYAEALTSVTGNALGSDFRMPNIKELASIVERSCTAPAIDSTIFNGTLNAIYYSSTPDDVINQHLSPTIDVKVIDFTNGTEFIPDVSKFRYVRLVRSI
ncbi:MAG: DUF1566 domain-containing protein [Colwellia sp.]|nr:DUF1566 domain-containing protein [Colwellia sp.]